MDVHWATENETVKSVTTFWVVNVRNSEGLGFQWGVGAYSGSLVVTPAYDSSKGHGIEVLSFSFTTKAQRPQSYTKSEDEAFYTLLHQGDIKV